MRPLSLTMQAFGSYGEKATIDFTKPEQNLFLVTGDTGAGKTTIFDALVFALYGEASSSANEKSGKELQSQFAAPGVEPFVELTFSEKKGEASETYRVRREPNHIRAKKRGSGFTEQGERVSLTMPEGKEYSNNLKETDKKLEEIVGLNKDQFMQVAMIAQGEFMELLRAKSDDKKEIFRKLFDTELYDRIVKEMDSRRREKKAESDALRAVCQAEVGLALIPEEAEGADELMSLKRQILSADRLNVSQTEEFLEKLKLLCEKMAEQEAAAEKEKEKTSGIRDEVRDALTKARSLLTPFQQLEDALRELAELQRIEEKMQEVKRTASAIRTAYESKAAYDRYADAGKAAAETARNLAQQRESLPALEQTCREAAAAEEKAQEKQRASQGAYDRTKERVQHALDILKKEKEARSEVSSGEKRRKKECEKAEEAGNRLDAFVRQVGDWQEEAERLNGAALQLEKWRQRKAEAAGIAADVTAVKKTNREVLSAQKKAERARQNYAASREKFKRQNAAYEEQRNAFLDAQAGFLAREKLVPGQPCPVCGSTEHPAPCELAKEERLLTREGLDRLAAQVSQCREEQEACAVASHAAEELLNEKEENGKRELEKLRDRMAKTLPQVPDPLSIEEAELLCGRLLAELDAQGEVLKEKADRLSELQEELKHAEEMRTEYTRQRDAAAAAKAEAEAGLAASRAKQKELEAQKVYPTEVEARAVLSRAKAEKEAADNAFTASHQAAREAGNAQEQAKTLIARFSEELPKRKAERDERRDAYEAFLSRQGLSESEWRALVKQYSGEQASRLQKQAEDFEKKKAAARRAFDNAKEQIGDRQRPDIEALEAAGNRAEENRKAAQQAYDRIRTQRGTNRKVCDNLAPKMEERGRIVEEQARIEGLYNRLAGKVKGGRMDIESFVQRYYMQRILEAANVRFREMSAGQFELRLIGEEQAGEGRTNQGLDLTVYSTVTGTEREVRTLSGGESFLAALSLALGMADQIRMSSAAVNLDIMFIDEGFGSLDDQSRNQAVRVLQQMAGGDKLVGIISHVTELKQQIDDQLIVTKDEKGSHARWQ